MRCPRGTLLVGTARRGAEGRRLPPPGGRGGTPSQVGSDPCTVRSPSGPSEHSQAARRSSGSPRPLARETFKTVPFVFWGRIQGSSQSEQGNLKTPSPSDPVPKTGVPDTAGPACKEPLWSLHWWVPSGGQSLPSPAVPEQGPGARGTRGTPGAQGLCLQPSPLRRPPAAGHPASPGPAPRCRPPASPWAAAVILDMRAPASARPAAHP